MGYVAHALLSGYQSGSDACDVDVRVSSGVSRLGTDVRYGLHTQKMVAQPISGTEVAK